MANCECIFHRYHVVHTIPGKEEVFDHSQGTWDTDLKGREYVRDYPSRLYIHGMTASELADAYIAEHTSAGR